MKKKMLNENFDPEGKVVAAIFAHPDDADFICAGTIAKFAEAGASCYYVILTNGSKGTNDPKKSREWVIKTRKREQEAAAKVLGVKEVIFLSHEDCELEANVETKGEVVRILRRLKPDVVLTFDPSRFYSIKDNYISHTDHRAVGEIVTDAVFPLSHSHLMYPQHLEEGLAPHKTAELWFSNFDKASFFVDITKTFDQKIAALACHKSQIADLGETKSWVEKWAKETGKSSKKYSLAEGFIRFQLS